MIVMALECSAVSASVALVEDDRLLAESFVNVRLTHSQTLMPMAESLLRSACLMLDQVDGFAVSNGPGSFTGVRIGVAAVKGMAQALGRPCAGVSTLEAMAWQTAAMLDSVDAAGRFTLCPVMDARCSQVYNALFEAPASHHNMVSQPADTVAPPTPSSTWIAPVRRCEDRAISIGQLCEELKKSKVCPYLVGDGAALCYNELKRAGLDCRIAPEGSRYQRAYGVALAAQGRFTAGVAQDACDLKPTYLRLPQAERDLKKRKSEKEE